MSSTSEDSNYLTETEIFTLLTQARQSAGLGTPLGETKALQILTQVCGFIEQIESSPQASLATQIPSANYLVRVDQIAAPLIGGSSLASANSITAFKPAYSNAVSVVEAVQPSITNPTQSNLYGTFAAGINLGNPVTITAPDGIAALGAPTTENYTFTNLGGGQISTSEIINSGTYTMTENAADLSFVSLVAKFTDGTTLTTDFNPNGTTTTNHINNTGTVTEIDTNLPSGGSSKQVFPAPGAINTTNYSDPNEMGVVTTGTISDPNDDITGTIIFGSSGLGFGFCYNTDNGDTLASLSVLPGDGNILVLELESGVPINLADVPLSYDSSGAQGSYDATIVGSASAGDAVIVDPTQVVNNGLVLTGANYNAITFGTTDAMTGTIETTVTVAIANGIIDPTPAINITTGGPGTGATLTVGVPFGDGDASVMNINGITNVGVPAGTTSTVLNDILATGTATTIENQGAGIAVVSSAASVDNFINAGTVSLQLGNGAFQTDPYTNTPVGKTIGNGTVTGTVTNNGTFTADGGTLDLTGNVSGTGTLQINSGAALVLQGNVAANQTVLLSGGILVLGTNASVNGAVIFNAATGAITGASTIAALVVGSNGTGNYQLNNGDTLVTGSLDAGGGAADVGQIGVVGAGTKLIVTSDATIADDGTGVLSVLNGATFSAANLTIGSQGDSSGAVVISGAGSAINLSGALKVGTALGIGDLTVGPGAAVHASVVNLQGQVVLEGGLLDPMVSVINQGVTIGGFGTIAADRILDEGVIQAGGAGPSARLEVVQGTVLGGGTLTMNGTTVGSNPAGVLQINTGGTLELAGPVLNAATTSFTDNLTPTGTYIVNNSQIDVTFADGSGVLLLDDIAEFGGTIASFQHGDQFVITGGTLSNLGVNNGNTLIFSDSGAGAGTGDIDQIIFNASISAAGFKIANGNTVQVACFVEGTRIGTESGLMAVEELRVGDRVSLARNVDASAPIAWIGKRAINCRVHPRSETVWPVYVKSGTFAKNVPLRDLWLSPDHAVFVDDVLIPIKHLINGCTIVQEPRDEVTYYHIELEQHDVIFAEGLPTESYLDTGDRTNFENGGGPVRVLPDFSVRTWEAKGCAPLMVMGPILATVRARLLQRAAKLSSQPKLSAITSRAA